MQTRHGQIDHFSSYGNRDIGGGIDRFWLTGDLRISAVEQIEFLRRLAADTLPFSPRAQETGRRISILESAPDYILRGKTGWAKCPDRVDLGWYVGWVERAGRRWFFALDIDMPKPADAAMRDPIVRAVLKRVGALPLTTPVP
jgi:beta-lactamase class D